MIIAVLKVVNRIRWCNRYNNWICVMTHKMLTTRKPVMYQNLKKMVDRQLEENKNKFSNN